MSTVHAIVEDILSKRRDLSVDQIIVLIEDKKKEGRGLLSDEGAARLVAEELLVQTRGGELGRMRITDLVSGLNDVTISGRVLLSWPGQNFQRRDGTPGRVMRLILVDRSGRTRCALWDRHVDVASRASELQGRILRIGHAYTRQGLAGDVEVHAGDRSSIEIDPIDLPITDFPELRELLTPIGAVTSDLNQVNALAVVQAEPRHYSFAKEDRTGTVLRTIIADESGTIPLVAWNERAEELREIKKGDALQILNARMRIDTNGRSEIHVESRSQVTILASPPEHLKALTTPRRHRIAELTDRLGTVDLEGVVLAKGEPREIKRPTGEVVKLASLMVSDESGIASLSLWDDKAELVKEIEVGDSIAASGVGVRDRLGELRLSLGKAGELRKVPGMTKEAQAITKLNALESAKGLLIVEGGVQDEPLIRQVVTEKGETIEVASFTLKDDVGSARVTLWRDQAASAQNLRPGKRLRLTGVRVRPGLAGQLELSSIPLTRIEMIEQAPAERPAWEDIRHVIALEQGLTTWIKGLVLDLIEEPRLVASCETCGSELNVSDRNFHCQKCGTTKFGNFSLSGGLRIDDGTSVIDVVLANFDPRQFAPIDPAEMREKMLDESKTFMVLGREALSNMIGKEIEVYGTAEQAGGPGKFQFKAKRVVALGKL